MAIKMTVSGTIFEVETAAEAVELHRLITKSGGEHAPTKAVPMRPPPRHTPESINGRTNFQVNAEMFFLDLNDNAKKIIKALVDHPEGLRTDELAEAAGVSTLSLPPIIKSLGTAARNNQLEVEHIVPRSQRIVNGKPKSYYKLTEAALEVAKNLP